MRCFSTRIQLFLDCFLKFICAVPTQALVCVRRTWDSLEDGSTVIVWRKSQERSELIFFRQKSGLRTSQRWSEFSLPFLFFHFFLLWSRFLRTLITIFVLSLILYYMVYRILNWFFLVPARRCILTEERATDLNLFMQFLRAWDFSSCILFFFV